MAPFDRLRRRAPQRVRAVLRQLGELVSTWIDRPPPSSRTDVPSVPPPIVPRATVVVSVWREHASTHAAKWIARVRDETAIDAAEHTRRVRVAIRRVRALARVIAEPPPADRSLRRRGRRLGELRDLDLALEHAVAARASSGSTLQHAALEELAGWLARRRAAALARVREHDDTLELGAELDAFAQTIVAIADDEPRARVLAASALDALARELAATLDPGAGEAELERLHAMRIAARRLRYVAELFDPCLGPRERELLARARDLQRAIGSHRDAAIWHVVLGERIAKAEARGHLTFARGLAEALPAASSASAREHLAIAAAIERMQAALARD